jgi:hypothetical protein
MLTYFTIKRIDRGIHASVQQQDIAYADNCMRVLELCASKDRIANNFYVQLRRVKTLVVKQLPTVNNLHKSAPSREDQLEDESWLFTPRLEDTRSFNTQKVILRMLCFPLNAQQQEAEELPYPLIAESFGNTDHNFAYHIASPFNTDASEELTDFLPSDNALMVDHGKDREDRSYVGESAPHGWSMSAFLGENQGGVE